MNEWFLNWLLWLSIWRSSHVVLVHLCLIWFTSGFSFTGTCNSTGFAPNTELVCVFYFWKASSPQYIKSNLIVVSGDLFIFASFGCCFFLLFCPYLYYVHRHVNLCKCGLVYLTNQFHFWCVFPFFFIELCYWSIHWHDILLHKKTGCF